MGAPMATAKPLENPADAFLQPSDGVAISYWIISIAMIAATVFFFAEAGTVRSHWKTSLHVGGLVTLVAGVHYMYMREYWVQVHKSPIVYRYVDWTITVPLQMIEFNLILKAAGKKVSSLMFWKLLLGTVVMLLRLSWRDPRPPWVGWLCGWHVWVGLHPLRDFRGRSRGHRCRLQPCGGELFLANAHDCDGGLVHLPPGLLLWLSARDCGRSIFERYIQHCRFRQQDRFRPCMLVVRQRGLSLEDRRPFVLSKAVPGAFEARPCRAFFVGSHFEWGS